jgi:DNA-directed RNA polymerase subunit RPC12/RpoP
MQDNFSDDAEFKNSQLIQKSDLEFGKYGEVLSLFYNCSLCGTPLDFAYTIEVVGEMIREEARCNHCEIRIRNKIFNIQ